MINNKMRIQSTHRNLSSNFISLKNLSIEVRKYEHYLPLPSKRDRIHHSGKQGASTHTLGSEKLREDLLVLTWRTHSPRNTPHPKPKHKEVLINHHGVCPQTVILLPDKGPGPERVCLGPAVMCGFLTSCRKDFTIRVQVTLRIDLLKLGTMKQGRAYHRGSNRRV